MGFYTWQCWVKGEQSLLLAQIANCSGSLFAIPLLEKYAPDYQVLHLDTFREIV